MSFKYSAIDSLRSAGILKFADWVKYWIHRAVLIPANLRFRRENPDFKLPPPDLAFDAFNNVNWESYKQVGRLHAGVFSDVIKSMTRSGDISILEWGCGPGRLIRHMGDLLIDHSIQLTGTDYNDRTIEWCRESFPDIHFVRNDLMPPLPFDEQKFDVIYCFSVFTHLSEEAQIAWASELRRVLKPGGLLVCSTHGDKHRHLLTSQNDIDTYKAGNVVVKGKYVEGKKWYLAIHPEEFVKNTLLSGFADVARVPVGDEKQLSQEVWVSVKPSS